MAHVPPPRPVITRPVVTATPEPEVVEGEVVEETGLATISRGSGLALLKTGYLPARQIVMPGGRLRRLMLGLYGGPGSGKSEFAMSAPGPGAHIVLDRGIDAALNNEHPPASRNNDWLFQVARVPKATQFAANDKGKAKYLGYWKEFYSVYTVGLDSTDARTVVLDGDADSWELQRLAEFGKLTQIPSIMYTSVNAARRAMYARAYDSGKIFISTSRMRKVYVDVLDAAGNVVLKDNGQNLREWNGTYDREGFDDQEHVWQILLFCEYDEVKKRFGAQFTRCKPNRSLEGQWLYGDECNFETMVQYVFPHIPVAEWGY